MPNNELTPEQQEYFRRVELIDADGSLRDSISVSKTRLKSNQTEIVRGINRVRGFSAN